MSLLHNPEYNEFYDIKDDTEGLSKLRWSQFMCKCGSCGIESGKMYMERLPVFILDGISREDRMRMDIELGYVSKPYADKMLSLPTKDPHRVGLAVRIRVINPMKRMKIVRGLIVRGVTRIGLNSMYITIQTT